MMNKDPADLEPLIFEVLDADGSTKIVTLPWQLEARLMEELIERDHLRLITCQEREGIHAGPLKIDQQAPPARKRTLVN